jgi:predicted transcriptional regulator
MRVTGIRDADDNSAGSVVIVGAPSIADPGVSSVMMTELMRPVQAYDRISTICTRFWEYIASKRELLW